MKWIRLASIELNNFGPFVGKHRIKLPETGLVLVRGKVIETGGGSGAGKSYLVNSPGFVVGGCPFAATELQSWYSEDAPGVKLETIATDGDVTMERCEGLLLKGGSYPKNGVRGRAAEAKLDELFGMDKELRALATHRGQDEPAVFLGMPDPKKKEVLTKLLRLDRFEKVAEAAAKAARDMSKKLDEQQGLVKAWQEGVVDADRRLAECAPVDPREPIRLAEIAGLQEKAAADLAEEAASALNKAEEARKKIQAATESQTKQIGTMTKALRLTDRPAEIEEVIVTLDKARDRLERVERYDQEQSRAFEKGRTELRLKLSQLGGERRAAGLALQAHLASKLATQRELVAMAKRQKDLLGQIAKLEAETCPTCGQEWCDDKSKEELESLRADADSLSQHLCKKQALDIEIENLKYNIANPVPSEEIAEVEAQLAEYGDYRPHPMGAELRSSISALTSKIDEMQQAWKNEIEGQISGLEAEEKRIRAKAALAADSEIQKYRKLASDLSARSLQEREAAQATRRQISVLETRLATRAERTRSVDTAKAALLKAMEVTAELEAKVNLELDVCAAVGREGFLGYIFDDVLAEIASATNEVLRQVANVRHVTFEFSVEKEALNGNITKTITPMVYSRGRKVSMAPGLSGGMGNAVRLAVDLGFGEVVSRRRGSYPGWLVLDESFNGLDRASKESCMEMLQVYAGDRLVLVVDHATEFQGLFSQIIEVEQVDGRSRIC